MGSCNPESRMSGKTLNSRVFFRDYCQVVVQDLAVLSGNGFKADSHGEYVLKDAFPNMDDPSLRVDWNAVDGEI